MIVELVRRVIGLVAFAVLAGSTSLAAGPQSDAQIRQAIIKQSLAEYSG